MIDNSTFKKVTNEFVRREARFRYFHLSEKLLKAGYEVEAMLLLLVTWNNARFRTVIKEFDLVNFQKCISSLKKNFDKLAHLTLETVNFDNYKSDIECIYNKLSAIKGVEYTGTSKVMHLKNPNLFVMWDGYIRGTKRKKYYRKLDIFKSGCLKPKKYISQFEGYFEFLKDVQKNFSRIKFKKTGKSLAKAIDEFNYIKITLEIQKLEKKELVSKKKISS